MKIKNSYKKNIYGDGYVKILETDDGQEYEIRNTCRKNIYGNGYEQEIIKKEKSSSNISGLFLLAGISLFILFFCIFFKSIAGIIICSILTIIFFLLGVLSESEGTSISFLNTLKAYLIFIGVIVFFIACGIGAFVLLILFFIHAFG